MRPCTQCGKCCKKYGGGYLGSATDDDLEKWESRPDIMRYIDVEMPDLWLSPVTYDDMPRCPWLRKLPNQEKYKCRIHDSRPWVCSQYPTNINQMINDGCEMLEDSDLEKPHDILMKELEAIRNASR